MCGGKICTPGAASRLLEQEHQRGAKEANDHQQPKLVHVGPERGLLQQRLVGQSVRLGVSGN